MIVVKEKKFPSCKTAKELYAAISQLGVLTGVSIDQRKLLVGICSQIDQGMGNPVVLDVKTVRDKYLIPDITAKKLLAMALFLSYKNFVIERENGSISLIRIFTKINAQGSTFRFYIDPELLEFRSKNQ